VFAGQTELGALGLGLGMVDQNVRHADALHRNRQTPVVDEFHHGRAEAAGQRMLFQRDETRVRFGQFEDQVFIQRFHEAVIRPLANTGQTRVWNLMIDVVAQTGRYPKSVTGLDKFLVEGEQRYWVHVAIDRFTGQVIDKQTEVVKE